MAFHYLFRVLLPRERGRVPDIRHALPRTVAAAVAFESLLSSVVGVLCSFLESSPAEVDTWLRKIKPADRQLSTWNGRMIYHATRSNSNDTRAGTVGWGVGSS